MTAAPPDIVFLGNLLVAATPERAVERHDEWFTERKTVETSTGATP